MLDFVIYICGHGETKDATARCLCRVYEETNLNFQTYWQLPEASLGHARSVACQRFLEEDTADYLVFLDSDQTFTPDDIMKLVEAMVEGYDIIAGAYPMGNRGMAIHPWEDIVWDGHIEELKYASAGFMGITRRALEQIKNGLELPLLNKGEWCECYPFFELKRCEQDGWYISEDWEFCNKAREAGLKVYLHTGVLVGHIKERLLTAKPDADYKLNIN